MGLARWILTLTLSLAAAGGLFFVQQEYRASQALQQEHSSLQAQLAARRRLKAQREEHARKVEHVLSLRQEAIASGLAPEDWIVNYLEIDSGEDLQQRLAQDPQLETMRQQKQELEAALQQEQSAANAAGAPVAAQSPELQGLQQRINQLQARIDERMASIRRSAFYSPQRFERLLTLLASPAQAFPIAARGGNRALFSPMRLVVTRVVGNSFNVSLHGAFLIPRQ